MGIKIVIEKQRTEPPKHVTMTADGHWEATWPDGSTESGDEVLLTRESK